MKLSQSTVVVFDLDDTLYPEREFVLSGLRAASEWLNKHEGVGGLYDRAARRFQLGERGHLFDDALRDLDLEASPERIQGLVDAYRQHRPEIAMPQPATLLLDELQGKGHRLSVLTDGHLAVQRNKVEALELEALVQVVIYSDLWGRSHWKPAPRPYRAVEEHFGVIGADCVYVADNPAKDFVGARRCGWRSIRFRWHRGDHAETRAAPGFEPDEDVENWPGLRTVLGLEPQ